MPNYLKMPKKTQVLALLELGWSYRRIEAETGVRRETVSGYDVARQANAAKTFPGSDPSPPPDSLEVPSDAAPNVAKTFVGSGSDPAKTFLGSPPRRRFAAARYRTAISEKLDAGLSLQRIWQDLVEEYGYGASYESVKRFARTIAPVRRAVGVFHCPPGAEAQVDFFRGAPTLDAATGEWRRPWVFRMTLGHSRHGYEDAVWDQKLETFLRLHERAFRDFGGVPKVIRHDNLKAAVVHACFFDPDSHDVYLAFATHWGFTPLPTQPRRPQENGKQERSGGYVKDNALKGRRFDRAKCVSAGLESHHRAAAHSRDNASPGVDALRRGRAEGVAATRRRGVSGLRQRRAHGPHRRPRRSRRGVLPGAARAARSAAPRAMPASCASFMATRLSWFTPGSRSACLRPAPARLRPRRVSKRTSIDSSANVSAWALRSSSGPTPHSPPEASAPFASFKASSA